MSETPNPERSRRESPGQPGYENGREPGAGRYDDRPRGEPIHPDRNDHGRYDGDRPREDVGRDRPRSDDPRHGDGRFDDARHEGAPRDDVRRDEPRRDRDDVRRRDEVHHHEAAPVDGRGAALPPRKSKGLGVAAMICGIVGLLLLFVPLTQLASIILCLLAIILGIIAAKKREGRGQGIAGIITGTIGVLLIALGVILTIVFGDEILQWAEQAEQEVNVVLNLPA